MKQTLAHLSNLCPCAWLIGEEENNSMQLATEEDTMCVWERERTIRVDREKEEENLWNLPSQSYRWV